MAELYRDKYRVQTTRLQSEKYNYGMYFVTICTHNRKYYFGHIDGDEPQMYLSRIGEFTDQCIKQIETIFPHVYVRAYQIMPNHIHMMIDCRETVDTDELPLKRTTLARIIGGLKQAVTKYARKEGVPFAWQERYYDHIIRRDDDLEQYRVYIQSNVINWHEDEYHAVET